MRPFPVDVRGLGPRTGGFPRLERATGNGGSERFGGVTTGALGIVGTTVSNMIVASDVLESWSQASIPEYKLIHSAITDFQAWECDQHASDRCYICNSKLRRPGGGSKVEYRTRSTARQNGGMAPF